MRILVIDDDQAVCEVFGEFLHEIGHEPVITHTAETALDTLREERPDAVLLDVCLPGMSGLDFMKLEAVRDLAVPILVRADDEGYAFAFKDRGDERLQELNELVRRSVG